MTPLHLGICGFAGKSDITDSKVVGINQMKLKK